MKAKVLSSFLFCILLAILIAPVVVDAKEKKSCTPTVKVEASTP